MLSRKFLIDCDLFVPCVVVLEQDVGECSSVEELLHVGEENPLAVLPVADSLVTCVTKSTLGVPVAPDVAVQFVRR